MFYPRCNLNTILMFVTERVCCQRCNTALILQRATASQQRARHSRGAEWFTLWHFCLSFCGHWSVCSVWVGSLGPAGTAEFTYVHVWQQQSSNRWGRHMNRCFNEGSTGLSSRRCLKETRLMDRISSLFLLLSLYWPLLSGRWRYCTSELVNSHQSNQRKKVCSLSA